MLMAKTANSANAVTTFSKPVNNAMTAIMLPATAAIPCAKASLSSSAQRASANPFAATASPFGKPVSNATMAISFRAVAALRYPKSKMALPAPSIPKIIPIPSNSP